MARHPSLLPALSEAQRAQANKRLALIRPALEEGISQAQIARLHHLSLSTIQRWVKQYREHGLAGLVRAPRSDRGNSRGLSPDIIQWIEDIARQIPTRSVASIHRQVLAKAQEQGWKPPSYARVYQIVQRLAPARDQLVAPQSMVPSQEDTGIPAPSTPNQTCSPYPIDPVPTLCPFPQRPLLASKLRPPHLHIPLLLRERLFTLLDAGLERKLLLLMAPAGYGKTTLLAQWVNQHQRPTAWLSLDNEDNAPYHFFAYLLAALQQIQPGIGQRSLMHVSELSSSSLITALVELLHELSSLPTEVIIILDNYHVITNQSVHSALTIALDHLPAHVHFVIASRSEPACPLARLCAAQQLTELDLRTLRFTHAEIEKLFLLVMHLALSPTEVDALEQHTEGWIAGLQLAGFALQGQQDIGHFLATFGGHNRYLFAYLLEEVFEPQPAHIRDFLLTTSLLETFNASLCSAVTGQQETAYILEYLERANLFCFPLEKQHGWYRYHPLFAEMLRHHLERTQSDLLPIVHQRASQWFEAQNLLEEAIKHALAAADVERAAALVEQIAPILIRHGRLRVVQAWLTALPHDLIHTSPRLCISMAWIMFITSQVHSFSMWVKSANQALHVCQEMPQTETTVVLQAEILALQAIHALSANDCAGAIATCNQALQMLPPENLHLRSLVALISGLASSESINIHTGLQAISEASSHIQATDHTLLLFSYIIVAQAELSLAQGRPSQAAQLYQQILETAAVSHAPSAFAIGLAHVGLGCLFWEWNDVQQAKQHLRQAWDLGSQNQAANLLIFSALLLVLISHVQGESHEANLWLQQVESVCRKSGHVELLPIVAASRVRLSLATGRFDEALHWMREHHHMLETSASKRDIFEKLTLVRVFIAIGRAHTDSSLFQRALALLERLRATAEEMGKVRVLLDILVQQALALQAMNDGVGALCALEQAISLAEPGKYIRVFVDEGNPMAKLLRLLFAQQRALKAAEQTTNLIYLCNLLNAFTPSNPSALTKTSTEGQPLLDPLSRREREVLCLMALGRKNREIADELVIVTGTVKAHINTIYQKLGVSSRVQALVRARTLGLL